MTVITQRLGSFEGGLCVFEIDYDDTNLYLVALRCVNNSDKTAWAQATLVSNRGKTGSRTFPAGQTTTLNLPSGVASRLGITLISRGAGVRVDGVEYQLMCPGP